MSVYKFRIAALLELCVTSIILQSGKYSSHEWQVSMLRAGWLNLHAEFYEW